MSKISPIKQWRIDNNWTQSELADELNELKVTRKKIDKKQISKWETGKHLPRNDTIDALAEIMGITKGELFKRINEAKM